MQKNSKRQPCPRLRTIDTAALAQVGGGRTAEQYHASIQMLELAMEFEPGSAWNVFFATAAEQ